MEDNMKIVEKAEEKSDQETDGIFTAIYKFIQ